MNKIKEELYQSMMIGDLTISSDTSKQILDYMEEKDREIERLTAESTEWESKFYDMQDNFHNANEEIERLNNIIKNLDKMFEYYFLGNLKYDQDTVNTIYIKYVKLKELKGEINE